MTEPPILTAKDMAIFAMRETHLKSYRRELLEFLEKVNGSEYVTEVRDLMLQMHRKGKK